MDSRSARGLLSILCRASELYKLHVGRPLLMFRTWPIFCIASSSIIYSRGMWDKTAKQKVKQNKDVQQNS